MTNRLLTLGITVVGIVGCGGSGKDQQGPTAAGVTTKLSGGQWFDGQEFVSKTFYSVAGVLTAAQPVRVDAVLAGTDGALRG
jgi:hypothetical protein